MTLPTCPWQTTPLFQGPGVGLYKAPQGLALLQLENAPKKNALGGGMVKALAQALGVLEGSEHPRVLVMAGQGSAFCSGADLADVLAHGDPAQFVLELGQVLWALARLPYPVVALAHGAVIGGGVGLLACADGVIAHRDTRFALAEVRLGLVPAVVSPFLFRKAPGPLWAPHVLGGHPFTWESAWRLGLVEGDGGVWDTSLWARVVNPYLAAAPSAAKRAKALLLSQCPLPTQEALGGLARGFGEACQSAEGRQGLTSFQKKEKPPWFVEML